MHQPNTVALWLCLYIILCVPKMFRKEVRENISIESSLLTHVSTIFGVLQVISWRDFISVWRTYCNIYCKATLSKFGFQFSAMKIVGDSFIVAILFYFLLKLVCFFNNLAELCLWNLFSLQCVTANISVRLFKKCSCFGLSVWLPSGHLCVA